jgi:hypothetical protein
VTDVRAATQPARGPAGDGALPRILFTAGWGRSGSTLLSRLLDEIPGFVSVGETRDIWQRGCLDDRLCGCGRVFSACEFWVAVGEHAFGGWGDVDAREMLELRTATDRPWSGVLTGHPDLVPGYRAKLDRYVDHLDRLFRAFRAVSGAEVVVEVSKHPSFGWLLASIPDVDLRVVHLVRDSRGVVHSWEKQVDMADGGTPMQRYGAMSAALRYSMYNTQAQRLSARHPSCFLRYEDLVADPRRHVLAIARLAGVELDDRALDFIGRDGVVLGPNHTVAGNPMRLRTGPVVLSVDDEWARAMPRAKRNAVVALTAPLLARYRYPLRTRAGTRLTTPDR